MIISALDKDTVKLLTTTQIVTSVSTATKELIENALDAGAKNIEINLMDNGCSLIEVKDDGCGVSKVDAPYMALPSYTSKILNFSDLDSLDTYGFRGEALYALSSVSNLVITTKTEDDEIATSYTIDSYGCIAKSVPCHRPKGTTVQVKQLFKQMPVRRQIVTNSKKASQDIRTLESLIKSYGMCKFFVRISYKVDKNVIFAKPSTATLEEAVTYTLGKKVTCNMSWLEIRDADIKMKLMVPSKETQNVQEVFQSGLQYIFVNDRPIKYKELEKVVTKVILEALGQESSSRKKPVFVLYILTNAGNIDVNLEPNKTSILFKEQNAVLNTIEKHLDNFYEIQREKQEENICDKSFAGYQDYTQRANTSEVDSEEPACKKRKLQAEENGCNAVTKNADDDENTLGNFKSVESNNSERKEQVETSTRGQNYPSESAKNDFNIHLPTLDLSDLDSNDSENFTLVYGDKDNYIDFVNKDTKEKAEDSPPLELSPRSETISQLPVVDLGEDFLYDDYSEMDTNGKENKAQNLNLEVPGKENKLKAKKPITLEDWSKGHISGLKGGTDVRPYNNEETDEPLGSNICGNVCEGFLKFSNCIRSEVMQKNPNITAPQAAQITTNLWKKLSPEERGYYRDLAREEKVQQRNLEKRETKEKHSTDNEKNRNRLLKALEKMKTMNLERKENLVMRTTIPWDMDLKKVTESFLNNTSCENSNLVIGLLHSNLWIVYRSAHIWILDVRKLKKELRMPDTNVNEDDAKGIEQLLEQWFSTKDDLSLLHPIHSLAKNIDSL